jgi:hypothetical protein
MCALVAAHGEHFVAMGGLLYVAHWWDTRLHQMRMVNFMREIFPKED